MIKEIHRLFHKQGGWGLLRQWLFAGVLWDVPLQLFLLGTSRKSLEILRLVVQYKSQKRLSRKYRYALDSFSESVCKNERHEYPNIIWICWFQGIDSAPSIVKKCYRSVCEHLKDWDIIVITAENYDQYTALPNYIINKWKDGKINRTHFSDLLRIDLLVRHGGLWMDATVFCTSGDLPDYITSTDLFMYQVLKPGLDGHCIKTSSWLISAKSNNVVLSAARALLFEYWKKNDRLVDYFLLHHFISISLDRFPEEWVRIPKVPNSIPHILLLQWFDDYDEDLFNHVKSMSPFHKLSYKRDEDEFAKKNTYYDVMMRE